MAHILNPIAIATQVVENPSNGGGDFLQAPGAWKGKIEEPEIRALPSANGTPFKGFTSTDGEMLSFRLGDNVGLDGQPEMGARKKFVDLTLRDGAYDLGTPLSDLPKEAWQLQRSQLALVRIADALGQTTKDGDMTVVDPEFVDAFVEGQFNGQEVGYIVYHGKEYEKKGVKTRDALIQTYFPA